MPISRLLRWSPPPGGPAERGGGGGGAARVGDRVIVNSEGTEVGAGGAKVTDEGAFLPGGGGGGRDGDGEGDGEEEEVSSVTRTAVVVVVRGGSSAGVEGLEI